jgi:formylglycine-generating enzyme required for sulfatase activity
MLERARSVGLGGDDVAAASVRVDDMRRERAASMLARVATALDARDLDQAAELLVRAKALRADAEATGVLEQRLSDARIYDHARPGEVLTDPFRDQAGTAPDLVVIPLGEYSMGADARERGARAEEQPAHLVRIIRPFALGRSEVSVGQFRRFVNATDFKTDAERLGSSMDYDEGSGRLSERKGISWRQDYVGDTAGDSDPVLHVSFNDAVAYLAWLSERTSKTYRLPSEAEFEYALRAGRSGRYPWGDGNPPRNVGNLTGELDHSPSGRAWNNAFPRYGDGYWGPAPTAKFKANPFGLFDLEGNVSEWVDDCWHDSFLRAPDDGGAWVNKGCDRRVVRGGSWGSSPDQVRSAYRTPLPPDVRSARVGFRVARDL